MRSARMKAVNVQKRAAGTIMTLAMAVAWTSPAFAIDYINDDFSTFTNNAALAGQHSWVQFVAASSLPIQITGNQVQIPFAQSADNQDVGKDLPAQLTLNSTTMYSFNLKVNNAPVLTTQTPSYFAAFLIDTIA